MRLNDLVRLSLTSIVEHKVRSLNIIFTIALLFGVVFGVQISLQGAEDAALMSSALATNGNIYVETALLPDYLSNEGANRIPENALEIVAERILANNGQIIGESTHYYLDNGTSYIALTVPVATPFLVVPLTSVPAGKIPVLIPAGREFSEEENKKLFIVGFYPVTGNVINTTVHPSLFNYALWQVISSPNTVYLIDDGSGMIEEYINMEHGFPKEDGRRVPTQSYVVALFDDVFDSVNYSEYYLDAVRFGYSAFSNDYKANNLFNNTFDVALSFRLSKFMIFGFELIFLIVAIVIATLTLMHVIDEEASTIMLYRSMGATTFQLMLIYFIYLFMLCLLAIIMVFIIALLVAVIIFLFNSGPFSRTLQDFYQLSEMPVVKFFGFNKAFLITLFSLGFVAPLAMLLSLRRFFARPNVGILKES